MKECSTCKIDKSLDSFYKSSDKHDGYKSQCKQCHNKSAHTARIYSKKQRVKGYQGEKNNPNIYLSTVYKHMSARIAGNPHHPSSARGQGLLTRIDFLEWVRNDNKFIELFQNYRKHNFTRSLAPSIDRININIGYVIGNIQWLTQSENVKKYHQYDKKLISQN